ncbi:hypothetical protein [Pajaroellobacter abortibovis]|nr:hypothetical protein [Pajaroellobacter abortibovis]
MGRACVWEGPYLVEMQYITNNDEEPLEELVSTSWQVFSELAKRVGEQLPGTTNPPTSVAALPSAAHISIRRKGVEYVLTDPLGIPLYRGGATGFYQEGSKWYRMISLVRTKVAKAKQIMAVLTALPTASRLSGIEDEAVRVMLKKYGKEQLRYLFARKGVQVYSIGDKELVQKGVVDSAASQEVNLSEEVKIGLLKQWMSASPGARSKSKVSPDSGGSGRFSQ